MNFSDELPNEFRMGFRIAAIECWFLNSYHFTASERASPQFVTMTTQLGIWQSHWRRYSRWWFQLEVKNIFRIPTGIAAAAFAKFSSVCAAFGTAAGFEVKHDLNNHTSRLCRIAACRCRGDFLVRMTIELYGSGDRRCRSGTGDAGGESRAQREFNEREFNERVKRESERESSRFAPHPGTLESNE